VLDCVRWQVTTMCDPIWQATPRSSEMVVSHYLAFHVCCEYWTQSWRLDLISDLSTVVLVRHACAILQFSADDRTNGRAYAMCCVRHLSSVTLCIVPKRCVLQQKLLLIAYRESYNIRNRLVPQWMTLTFV